MYDPRIIYGIFLILVSGNHYLSPLKGRIHKTVTIVKIDKTATSINVTYKTV